MLTLNGFCKFGASMYRCESMSADDAVRSITAVAGRWPRVAINFGAKAGDDSRVSVQIDLTTEEARQLARLLAQAVAYANGEDQ